MKSYHETFNVLVLMTSIQKNTKMTFHGETLLGMEFGIALDITRRR